MARYAQVERWRWENDPFGRTAPIEETVATSDVSPDDDSSTGSPAIYSTCCCTSCGVSGCGTGTTGCASNCCDGGDANGLVWTKTYTPGSATNVRVHFSEFDVAAGATRTAKDYVVIENAAPTTVATLTGDLGAFWGPWTGDGTAVVKLYADNVADGTRGVVVDKLEYTTATNGTFVLHLRMPGQIWDDEVLHSYNYHRWYRPQDGRYVSPDPIGLGGNGGYGAPARLYARRPLPTTARSAEPRSGIDGLFAEQSTPPFRLTLRCPVICDGDTASSAPFAFFPLPGVTSSRFWPSSCSRDEHEIATAAGWAFLPGAPMAPGGPGDPGGGTGTGMPPSGGVSGPTQPGSGGPAPTRVPGMCRCIDPRTMGVVHTDDNCALSSASGSGG